MATHSSTLAWKMDRGQKSLVGYSPWGLKELDMTERLHFHFSLFMHWRRKWQPTPLFLPGESQGRWLPSMGLHRVRHDLSDLAAAVERDSVSWNAG